MSGDERRRGKATLRRVSGRGFPVAWFAVALAIAVSTVLWGEWAGGLEPQEMCATKGPSDVGSYHTEPSRWPPGTTCVYEVARAVAPIEVDVAASRSDWLLLAGFSLAAALVVLALFFGARSLALALWRRGHSL